MRGLLLLSVLISTPLAAAMQSDEARVEQLLSGTSTKPAPAPPKAPARGKAAEIDDAAGLVGQRVVVQTQDRGVYLGTLTAVTRESLTLAITAPSRSVSQTIPRQFVSAITPR